MPLKYAFRLIVLAVLVTAFFFLFVRGSHTDKAHRAQREDAQSADAANRSHSERRRNRTDQTRGSLEANSGLSCSSEYLAEWAEPSQASCQVRVKDGFPLPDPACTPGGINPTVSLSVLRDPRWRTRLVRNCAVSEAQKHIAYRWYDVQKPRINSNQNQVCKLDHLVPLELGGADGMGNIWPQCGPDAVALRERYFKQKDKVENYLSEQVKAGSMPLADAQRGIATDWTQYLPAATRWCQKSRRC